MVGATGTFASGLGPGLQSQPAVAPCNFACVLSPVVPLVLMKAEAQRLGAWVFWVVSSFWEGAPFLWFKREAKENHQLSVVGPLEKDTPIWACLV